MTKFEVTFFTTENKNKSGMYMYTQTRSTAGQILCPQLLISAGCLQGKFGTICSL
jgi:hypothetical protein